MTKLHISIELGWDKGDTGWEGVVKVTGPITNALAEAIRDLVAKEGDREKPANTKDSDGSHSVRGPCTDSEQVEAPPSFAQASYNATNLVTAATHTGAWGPVSDFLDEGTKLCGSGGFPVKILISVVRTLVRVEGEGLYRITPRDRESIERIRPQLREAGLMM